ncbi:MAG: hypothetical protein ACRD1E_02945 [Terriglobales bacterium]
MQSTSLGGAGRRAVGRLGRAALMVLGIEVGLLLLILPWTALWTRSPWLLAWHPNHPALVQTLLSGYLRGAVSGLGLLNLWNAASEIAPFRS